MAKLGPRVAPENTLPLVHGEAYAGTSKSEWEAIACQLELMRPVKVDHIEPENQQCDICRESFGPSDNGASRENPVSLPCGPIFGNDCLWNWIVAGSGVFLGEVVDIVDQGQLLETVEEHVSVGPSNYDDLLEKEWLWFRKSDFTCPKCRKRFKVILSEEAPNIEARLRLWDHAYEKLDIVRSAEEEMCRQDLWRLVENMNLGEVRGDLGQIPSFKLRAQVSVMRFAIRRAQWDLTPVQCHLRDALFNLGCFGANDAPEEYCADSYENRPLPMWSWQFDRIERGMNPCYDQSR
ncbi:hypothetical protein MMC22_004317 [Lobaria immixta]|nr:hypothetical protein [Lobaria immixta]